MATGSGSQTSEAPGRRAGSGTPDRGPSLAAQVDENGTRLRATAADRTCLTGVKASEANHASSYPSVRDPAPCLRLYARRRGGIQGAAKTRPAALRASRAAKADPGRQLDA